MTASKGPAALALSLLLAAGLVLASGILLAGCAPRVTGPPLLVLGLWPDAGDAMPADRSIELVFNFPIDTRTLEGSVTVRPRADLELTVTGQLVSIRVADARIGQVYAVEISQDLRGTGGQRLTKAYTTSVFVVPAGTEIGPRPGVDDDEPPSPVAFEAFLGAQLLLDGHVVSACDLPGAYEVPRFDRLRIFLAGFAERPQSVLPVLVLEGAGGSLHPVEVGVQAGDGWIDLIPKGEIRTGSSYACILLTVLGEDEYDYDYLWRLAVRGVPRTNVWSLNIETGRASPVGHLELGYEVDALVGGPGSLFAVGSPGGMVWRGLELIQAINDELTPVGPPVAAIRAANMAERQVNAELGLMVAVGPLSPPPLVGDREWGGFDPREHLVAQPDWGAIFWEHPEGLGSGFPQGLPQVARNAVVALGHGLGEPVVLLQDTDIGGGFISGPSLRSDGAALALSSQSFAAGLEVRSWRRDLPEGWWERESATGILNGLIQESARVVYEQVYVGEYGYAGGTVWVGETHWWDIYLPDGHAETWQIDSRGVHRSLVATGAAAPYPSPDGRLVLLRTASGAAIITSSGEPVRSIRELFLGATWLPDSSGLLLAGDRGIFYVPLTGQISQMSGFSAQPGCFVNEREYWFVSDRRF